MNEERKVFDVFQVKYDDDEAKSLRLSRETKREISKFLFGNKGGRDLLFKKAFLYKMLLKYRIWLDKKITHIEKELADANVEAYFTDDSSVVIARELEGLENGEKIVFVEPLNFSNSNRARDFMLGKELKGKNVV